MKRCFKILRAKISNLTLGGQTQTCLKLSALSRKKLNVRLKINLLKEMSIKILKNTNADIWNRIPSRLNYKNRVVGPGCVCK